ncbi:MAG: hypothetical protein WDO24_04805 [Pseudomonadota bacterium]
MQQGALLAALDDRDLALERLRWVTERQQSLYQYDKALSERNGPTRCGSRASWTKPKRKSGWSTRSLRGRA